MTYSYSSPFIHNLLTVLFTFKWKVPLCQDKKKLSRKLMIELNKTKKNKSFTRQIYYRNDFSIIM